MTQFQDTTIEARPHAPWQRRAEEAIDAIESSLHHNSIVRPTPAQQTTLDGAIERARGTLLGSPEPVLLVAIVGPSGAGKSSLINALAGDTIAKAGPIRPTTRELTVYHHESVVQGSLPADLIDRAHFVGHTRDELRNKVLIDTPDIDTFVRSNRELTRDLLKAVGLVLCTVSPERYLEERLWSVLKTEAAQDAVVFVVNKRDMCSGHELSQIAADISQHLHEIGLDNVPVLSAISASGNDTSEGASADTSAVATMLTKTLSASDAAVLARQARDRAVSSVRTTVERVCARTDTLAALHAASQERTSRTIHAIADRCRPDIESSAHASRPDMIVANHALFWGPMRAWLGVWDMMTIGVPTLLSRVGPAISSATPFRLSSANLPDGHPSLSQQSPLTARVDDVADTIEHIAAIADQTLLMHQPPLTPLTEVVPVEDARRAAEALLARTASMHTGQPRRGTWKHWIAWMLSLVSTVGTIGLLALAVYHLGKEVWLGTFGGINVLVHAVVFGVALHVAIHLLTSVVLPTGWKRLAASMRQRCIAHLHQITASRWDGYLRIAADERDHLDRAVSSLERAVRSAGTETASQSLAS